jgi:hypothetical protein
MKVLAHLYKFRQGWQSENIARFILSHFSFIAQPSTIADDVGNDFFCTLFKKEGQNNKQYLVPKNTFAIQIKSSAANLDLSKKAAFLEQMEVPFFIGVVNRKKLSLKIYSGRALHLLFTMKGVPNKMIVQLKSKICEKKYYKIDDEKKKNYTVIFPLLAEIDGMDLDRTINKAYFLLTAECSLIYQNIASRKMNEFILRFEPDDLRIFAGPGSAKQFRHNFFYRLAEVFYNFEWIMQSQPNEFSVDEFSAFAECWERTYKYASASDKKLVDNIYERCKKSIERNT